MIILNKFQRGYLTAVSELLISETDETDFWEACKINDKIFDININRESEENEINIYVYPTYINKYGQLTTDTSQWERL